MRYVARGAYVLRPLRAAVLVAALAACGAVTRHPGAGDAVIQFDCQVADAEVWVDGQFVPGALQRGISIDPGSHQIEVRHDRYHPFFIEVTVEKAERRVIAVRLAEILP